MELALDLGNFNMLCKIYVGKHFPSDIAAGALLGVLAGTTMARIFELFQGSKLSIQKISFRFNGKHAQNQI